MDPDARENQHLFVVKKVKLDLTILNGIDLNAKFNVYKVPEFCNISLATMDVGGVSLFSTLL